ncbi:MAG: RidA family protein [Nitrospirota bacterium]
MTPEERLKSLGITLPEAPQPLGAYVPCVQTGTLLYVSGILPLREGALARRGKVGDTVSPEDAREDARQIVINALAVVTSFLGSLERVKRCVRLNGYVASAPDFAEQPKVLNAASDLLFEILGDAGRHTRTAIGVAVLPLDAPLEIDFIFEIAPQVSSDRATVSQPAEMRF